MAVHEQIHSANLGRTAANCDPFGNAFRRSRFLVLPTGRTIYSWGIWDSQKNPLGSIPTSIFRMKDFVSRHRNLVLAYKAARKLNAECEQERAA